MNQMKNNENLGNFQAFPNRKNKTEIINNIWLHRKFTLDKLYLDMKWLLRSQKPLNQKFAIWQRKYDMFVLKMIDQDITINKLVKNY